MVHQIDGRTLYYDDEAGRKGRWPFWGCFGPFFPPKLTSADLFPEMGSERDVWINCNVVLNGLGLDLLGEVRGAYVRQDGSSAIMIFKGGSFGSYPIG